MKLIEFGDGVQVGELKVNRNIVIVDDISKIQTLVVVGNNGTFETIDMDGNEVHTPESYSEKLRGARSEFFEDLENIRDSIASIKDELLKKKLNNALAEAKNQPLDEEGEWKFKRALNQALDFARETGVAVLSACIVKYFEN